MGRGYVRCGRRVRAQPELLTGDGGGRRRQQREQQRVEVSEGSRGWLEVEEELLERERRGAVLALQPRHAEHVLAEALAQRSGKGVQHQAAREQPAAPVRPCVEFRIPGGEARL